MTLYKDTAGDGIPIYIQEAGDFLASGDSKLCIDHLNNAHMRNVESPWGWIIAATAHCQLGNFKMAIEVSTRGLQFAGENSCLLDCLGVAHAGLGDLTNAKLFFQKAEKSNTKNANCIINLANIHLLHNAIDAAFDVLEQGLKNNPDDADLKYLYIQLHPIWALPIENGRIRIRVRTSLDDQFVRSCYANEHFMYNYHRYLAGALRKPKLQKNSTHSNRLSVYKNKCIQWIIERISPLNHGEIYTPIGLASLAEINLMHRRAEILIGFPDTKFNGTRIPLSVMLMLLNYAFNTIGFNKLVSIVYADNLNAQRSTIAIGFKQEGFLKDHLFDRKLNYWLSIYQNSMLIEDFRRNIKLTKFSNKLLRRELPHEPPSLFHALNF